MRYKLIIPIDAIKFVYLFRFHIMLGGLIGAILGFLFLHFSVVTYTTTALVTMPNLSFMGVLQDDKYPLDTRLLLEVNKISRVKNTKVEVKDNIAVIRITSAYKQDGYVANKISQELKESFINILDQAIKTSDLSAQKSQDLLNRINKEIFNIEKKDMNTLLIIETLRTATLIDSIKNENRAFYYREILNTYKLQDNISILQPTQKPGQIITYLKFIVFGVLSSISLSLLFNSRKYFSNL